MKQEPQNCGECRFFKEYEKKYPSWKDGSCRRHAPTCDNEGNNCLPDAYVTDWCGDGEKAEESQP